MKKQAWNLLIVLTCAALFTGGCAKKDLVKNDQPLAPGVTAAGNSKTEPVQAEPAQTEPVLTAGPVAIEESAVRQAPESAFKAGEPALALDSIHFDFDSYTLSPQARDLLTKNAQLLKQGQKVRIAGHCDERGSDDYNLALSERRAESARKYLVALGVAAEGLSVIGYGKEKPAAPGHDAASWAENRRDEFEIWAQ